VIHAVISWLGVPAYGVSCLEEVLTFGRLRLSFVRADPARISVALVQRRASGASLSKLFWRVAFAEFHGNQLTCEPFALDVDRPLALVHFYDLDFADNVLVRPGQTKGDALASSFRAQLSVSVERRGIVLVLSALSFSLGSV